MMLKKCSLVAASIAAIVLTNGSQAMATTYDAVSVSVPVSFLGYIKPSTPAKSYSGTVTCTVAGMTAGTAPYPLKDEGLTAYAGGTIEEYIGNVSSVQLVLTGNDRLHLTTGATVACRLTAPDGFAASSQSVLQSSAALP